MVRGEQLLLCEVLVPSLERGGEKSILKTIPSGLRADHCPPQTFPFLVCAMGTVSVSLSP